MTAPPAWVWILAALIIVTLVVLVAAGSTSAWALVGILPVVVGFIAAMIYLSGDR